MIRHRCTDCGALLENRDCESGKPDVCPACGAAFVVPGPVRFRCPKCGSRIQRDAPTETVVQKCPTCGQKLRLHPVPRPKPPPPTPPPAMRLPQPAQPKPTGHQGSPMDDGPSGWWMFLGMVLVCGFVPWLIPVVGIGAGAWYVAKEAYKWLSSGRSAPAAEAVVWVVLAVAVGLVVLVLLVATFSRTSSPLTTYWPQWR